MGQDASDPGSIWSSSCAGGDAGDNTGEPVPTGGSGGGSRSSEDDVEAIAYVNGRGSPEDN